MMGGRVGQDRGSPEASKWQRANVKCRMAGGLLDEWVMEAGGRMTAPRATDKSPRSKTTDHGPETIDHGFLAKGATALWQPFKGGGPWDKSAFWVPSAALEDRSGPRFWPVMAWEWPRPEVQGSKSILLRQGFHRR